jgi:hypothetical protein
VSTADEALDTESRARRPPAPRITPIGARYWPNSPSADLSALLGGGRVLVSDATEDWEAGSLGCDGGVFEVGFDLVGVRG